MAKSFIDLIVGDLDEKRAWKQITKRVNTLPRDYRFAYKRILGYGYNNGFCYNTQSGLLELFEESAAAGRKVSEVVGSDIAAFCDELICVSTSEAETARGKLNKEISEHFARRDNSNG